MAENTSVYPTEIGRAVNRLCSSLYTKMFEKVAKLQPTYLSNSQRILLTYYPNEITWYQGEKRKEIIERIRRTHLSWFNNWLSKNNTGRPPYIAWSSVMNEVMLHATNLFFRIDLDEFIISNSSRRAFRKIADTIKSILSSTCESNPIIIDSAVVLLVQELLLILFYFTFDNELVIYLKSLRLVDILNVILQISSNDDDIHLRAYRILAVIMTEEEIEQLQNLTKIAAIFITFIRDAIDGGVLYEPRLHNSLRSLKVLTQHDQIRDELVKQGGHFLFIRCALEDQFNLFKAKIPALEILLVLTFNIDFITILKNNMTFMDHIRPLSASKEPSLQRVASALIWKLEQEPETIVKTSEDQQQRSISSSTITKKPYDIMISYAHNDKQLCYHILNLLERDQLRVWIDFRCTNIVTSDTIAKAIENSEFLLICMSDAYKQNPFCEMEARYGSKCQCHIIPIVMTANYRPDGWLRTLIATLIQIDFSKLGLDKGYQELQKQMEFIRLKNLHCIKVQPDEVQHNSTLSINDITHETVTTVENNQLTQPILKYPHCIDMWTQDHVKQFLLDKGLDNLQQVFEGMNGYLLHRIYDMCESNQQVMFSSLKEDVARSQLKKTLNLKDYVTFLEEIKVYVPFKTSERLNRTSTVCTLM